MAKKTAAKKEPVEEVKQSTNTLNRATLIEALKIANFCTSNKPIVPILTHICFTGEEIRAFNGIQGVCVDLVTEFVGCIPGDVFTRLVSSYNSKDVTLKVKGSKVKVDNAEFAFKPVEDFVFGFDMDNEIHIKASLMCEEEFVNGLEYTLSTVDKNSLVPETRGVTLIVDDEGKTCLCSNDRSRISYYSLGTTEDCKDVALIMPETFCRVLLQMMKSNKSVELLITEQNEIAARFPSGTLLSKINAEAVITDYKKIISEYEALAPEYHEVSTDLLDVLKRSYVIVGGNELIDIESDENKLSFTSKNPMVKLSESVVFKAGFNKFSAAFSTGNILEALNKAEEFSFVFDNSDEYEEAILISRFKNTCKTLVSNSLEG